MAFPTGYSAYQEVVIQSSKVTADLTDFVVYVAMSDLVKAGADVFDSCRTDGGDIRVTKSDGTTQLPREVASIDTTGKTGSLFIKFSGTLSSTTNTTIRIYYNGTDTEPAVTSTYGRNNVWSNYAAVLHLGEAANTTSGGYLDSSGNSADGTGNAMGEAAVSGPLEHLAQDFDGTTDYITIADDFGLDGTIDFSLFAWVKYDDNYNQVDAAVLANNPATLDFGYYFAGTGPSSNYDSEHRYGKDGYGSKAELNWTTAPSNGTWYPIHLIADVSGKKVWGSWNGVYEGPDTGTYSTSGMSSLVSDMEIARRDNTKELNGKVSEVRVSLSLISENYTDTDYNNQNSPSTFYTTGDEEGGSTVILPAKQALTISQKAVTIAVSETVAVAKQALTISQKAVTLSTGNLVAVAKQSLAISQKAATIKLTTSVGKQSLAISQKAVTLSTGSLVAVAKQAIVISQKSVNATIGEVNLVAKQALTISQKAVTLNTGNLTSVAKQSVVISQKAVTVGITISVAKQGLIISQKSVTLNTGNLTSVAKQALVISQKSVNVTVGEVNLVAKQGLTISQKAVTILVNETVAVTKQSLTVSQKAVTISVAKTVLIAKQPLTISQKAVSVDISKIVTVGKQGLVISQKAVTLSTGNLISVAKQSLVVSQKSVNPTIGEVNLVGKQGLIISQKAITLSIDKVVSVTKQALTISQKPVTIDIGIMALVAKQGITISQKAAIVTVQKSISVAKQSLIINQKAVIVDVSKVISLAKQNLTINQKGIMLIGVVNLLSNEMLMLTSSITVASEHTSTITPIRSLNSVTHENL